MMGLTLGFGRVPRGQGQGFVAELQGASPRSRGCTPNPARLGMGAGGKVIWMWGPYAHIAKVSVPGIWRLGPFPTKEAREGRRSTPQKHQMKKTCLDLALG